MSDVQSKLIISIVLSKKHSWQEKCDQLKENSKAFLVDDISIAMDKNTT